MQHPSTVHSYRNLIVWQKAMELVVEVYDLTAQFPKEERYGLVAQMCKSAASIPSNIAEGRRRSSRKQYLEFLHYAYASGAELETQIEICKRIHRTKHLDYSKADALLNEVMRMMNVMIAKLQCSHP